MGNLNDAQLAELRVEIDTDPLGRGYAGMTDLEVSVSGNTLDRPSSEPITVAEWELAIRKGGKWVAWQERAEATEPDGSRSNPTMFEIMSTFQSRTPEADLRGDPYWSGLLDQAVLDDELGEGAAEAQKALCDVTISRATEIGHPRWSEEDVRLARAL